MIKLTGILLAVIGASRAGFLKASEIRRRRELLMDFRELILHISTEISYFKEPLPQIFERLTEGDNRESHILLRQCLLSYRQEHLTIAEIWNHAIDLTYERTPLTGEDISVMKKCGEFLGQSDFRGQQEHFQLFNVQLDRQIHAAEESIRTKGRLYGKIGVAAGLAIAVIFI